MNSLSAEMTMQPARIFQAPHLAEEQAHMLLHAPGLWEDSPHILSRPEALAQPRIPPLSAVNGGSLPCG